MTLKPDMNVVDAARKVLPQSAAKFFKRGRKAMKEGDAESLHAFRVSAKKFRYALELFEPLYGPQFRRKLSMLKKLQDLLGRLNDLATARPLLGGKPGSVPLLGFLDRAEKEVRGKFETYWTEQMDASGAEARWLRYLVQYAGQSSRQTMTRQQPQ